MQKNKKIVIRYSNQSLIFLATEGANLAGVRPLRQGGREGDADVRRRQLSGTERAIDFDYLSIVKLKSLI